MKDFFKYVLVVIVCLSCMLIFNFALEPSIVSIQKGESNGIYDTYILKYSNGKSDTITIKNGENGEDLSLQELYEATKIAKGYGDEYTMLDFIDEYLSLSIEEKDESKAYLGALSTVAVYSTFPTYVDLTAKKAYGVSIGSGVIYQTAGDSDNFYIITNYHVLYNKNSLRSDKMSEKYTCFLFGSNVEVNATQITGGYSVSYGSDAIDCAYVGGSMENDIAVLKVKDSSRITNSNAKPVKVYDGDPVMGQSIVAIGNSEGKGISVTKGVISVDSEYQSMLACDDETQITFRAMRIDAAVNSGNSGGGVFDTNGKLVGIVNSKIIKDGVEGMAFALPATLSTRIIDNIIENSSETNKSAIKPTLGIKAKIVSSKAEYDSESKGVKILEEVVVDTISDNSICEDLKSGDKIVSVIVSGKEYIIDRFYKLKDLTWIMKKGSVVIFNVIRANNPVTISVVMSNNSYSTVK